MDLPTPDCASHLTRLVCPECNRSHDPDRKQTFCRDCASPLLAEYDLEAVGRSLTPEKVKNRPRGLWRWAEMLPVRDPSYRNTLGEGDTPLLHADRLGAELGLNQLYIKNEGCSPTGTFKDRGLAVAVARGAELGVRAFVIPTAGNAGGALAAYAARFQCVAHIFMPGDAPRVNQAEVGAFGAQLHLVDGLIDEAGRQGAAEALRSGWFDVSTLKEPYRLEGKKTMGLEIAEAFRWDLPEVIIYPTGGGTGLIGMWKAFHELRTLGWVGDPLPRMVSVQSEGCAPIVRAFEAGRGHADYWPDARTSAAGLRVPLPFADRLILKALDESGGTALAVSEEEIAASTQQMGRLEGVFAAPEGGAALAAARKLSASGWLTSEDRVVLFNTGSGFKYL
jgi:threonine synthase